MTTQADGVAPVSTSTQCPRIVFYERLARVLSEGGFDRHMAALCKPFITNAVGPAWWSSQPSSYFRILFVGYLEGIESEQDLCWQLEDSRSLREFVGFDASTLAPDPMTLARIRQPLLPLIHSEAFDALLRIVDKAGLLEGRVPGLDAALLASDPAVTAIARRIRSKDHQDYWKRLTKMPGVGYSRRSSLPPPPSPAPDQAAYVSDEATPQLEPFALWTEDLSLAQAAFNELRAQGITDFRSHFDQHDSHAIDHVIRACVFGRGPNSVRAFPSDTQSHSARELPQQMSAASFEACKTIAVALAEGRKHFGIEVPLVGAEGEPAIAAIKLAIQPGYEESLGSVLVSFTDITRRKRVQPAPQHHDTHVEQAVSRAGIGVWEWDIAHGVSRWSDTMLSIYGITREEFSGRHTDYLDHTYPEDRDIQRDSIRQSTVDVANLGHSLHHHASSSATFKDYRIRRKDGQNRWVRGSAVEMVDDQGRPVKMQGVLWDITERKYAELLSKESDERYRHMVDRAALPIVVTAFDGEVIFANDSALSFFDVSHDDLEKLRAPDFWEDPTQRTDAASILAEQGELRDFVARYRIGPNRTLKVTLMTASVIEYGGRNVILSYHQELTDLERRNRELAALNRVMTACEQEPSMILGVACRELGQAFEWPLAMAGLLVDDRTELCVVAEQIGPDQRSWLGARLALTDGMLVGLFSEDPHPLWIDDASNDARAAGFRGLLTSGPNASLLLLPLVVDQRLVGVLFLGTGSGRELDADTMSLASNVTGQVSRSLAMSRVVQAHQRLSVAFERIREIIVTDTTSQIT